jgi:hypothetical protein
VVGDIEAYGLDVTANGTFTSTGAGAQTNDGILLKAKRSVFVAGNTSLRTNSNPVTIWSDSDANNEGAVAVAYGSTICTEWNGSACLTTGGADITIGGGAADSNFAAGNRPGGYATGSGTVNPSGFFGATTSGTVPLGGVALGYTYGNYGPVKLLSAGGNITVRGQTTASTPAAAQYAFGIGTVTGNDANPSEINASGGKVLLDGKGRCATLGSASGCAGMHYNAWGSYAGSRIASTNTAADAVKILAVAADGTTGVNGIRFYERGLINSSGGVQLITTSIDSPIGPSFGVAGDLLITSPGRNFNTATTINGNWLFTVVPKTITIGNDGAGDGTAQNTGNLVVTTALSATNAVKLYGGNIDLTSGNIEATAVGGAILAKATGYIITNNGASVASPKLFQTNNGPITLWADAENNLSGRIWIGTFNKFNSKGGNISIAGGADDGGTASGISSSVMHVPKAPAIRLKPRV